MNFQNALFWLACRLGYVCATGHALALSITLFHSSPHINQTLPLIFHILHFCLVNSLLNYAPDVFNWIEVMTVWRPQIMNDECDDVITT